VQRKSRGRILRNRQNSRPSIPASPAKTIKIGQDGESVPFSMRDPKDFTKLIGLDADLAQATFACIGVPVQFTIGTWSGLIPAAMSGQIDVMWDTLLYTPERAKKLEFRGLYECRHRDARRQRHPKNIHALGDLCGLTDHDARHHTGACCRDASSKCVAAGKPAVTIITSTDMPKRPGALCRTRGGIWCGQQVRRRQQWLRPIPPRSRARST